MTDTLLLDAGAPELPEEHFYRVKPDHLGPVVEIRRKRYLGSALVTEAFVHAHLFPSGLAALVDACRKAEGKLREMESDRRLRREAVQLVGDYAGKSGDQ
ncbi:hypothetical protein [Streptomyces sp. DH10]|uniref:hypothetical protein n=1 Tax=Streptomyces sp. DH10 TaxID=3040121 RepID=UPI002441744D|nr:hypothetical protein [Streptomyces sp. DH10]MDG9711131.1 hypothetical protein [Streptomyces sp. DH10]